MKQCLFRQPILIICPFLFIFFVGNTFNAAVADEAQAIREHEKFLNRTKFDKAGQENRQPEASLDIDSELRKYRESAESIRPEHLLEDEHLKEALREHMKYINKSDEQKAVELENEFRQGKRMADISREGKKAKKAKKVKKVKKVKEKREVKEVRKVKMTPKKAAVKDGLPQDSDVVQVPSGKDLEEPHEKKLIAVVKADKKPTVLNETSNFLKKLFNNQNPLTRFELGTEISHYVYREPDLMRDSGELYGVYAILTRYIPTKKQRRQLQDLVLEEDKVTSLSAEINYKVGSMNYVSQGTGTYSGTPYRILDTRLIGRYDLPAFKSSKITPFGGFGYRYLKDDFGGKTTTTNNWGYDRESKIYHWPVCIFICRLAWSGLLPRQKRGGWLRCLLNMIIC